MAQKPDQFTYFKIALHNQSQDDERKLVESLLQKCRSDPLAAYSLQIKSDPAMSQYDFNKNNSPTMHTKADGLKWRSATDRQHFIPIPAQAVIQYAKSIYFQMDTNWWAIKFLLILPTSTRRC